MGEIDRGGVVPEDLVRAVPVPTLVLAGGASPDFFRGTAAQIAGPLSNGECRVLAGQDHDASADAVAPVVAEFLGVAMVPAVSPVASGPAHVVGVFYFAGVGAFCRQFPSSCRLPRATERPLLCRLPTSKPVRRLPNRER